MCVLFGAGVQQFVCFRVFVYVYDCLPVFCVFCVCLCKLDCVCVCAVVSVVADVLLCGLGFLVYMCFF